VPLSTITYPATIIPTWLGHSITSTSVALPYNNYTFPISTTWAATTNIPEQWLVNPTVWSHHHTRAQWVTNIQTVETSRVFFPAQNTVIQRTAMRTAKQALIRSAELYKRHRGSREMHAFLCGRPFVIHGHRFDYRITKTKNLLHNAMHPHSAQTPYKLELLTKAGMRLSSGCVYINDTPIFDQLLALALHVQDAEAEQDYLRITVWSPKLPTHIQPLRMAA
jgi:hypothetical protein